MTEPQILLLHPGAMGAAIGARLRARGLSILWASDGRSDESVRRARAADLTDCETIAQGLESCQIVLSVCPPHGAVELAQQVADLGFTGQYIDANAISPQSSAQISKIVSTAGATFTDGGIIGPPPAGNSQARLYLSGGNPHKLAELLNSPPLTTKAMANGEFSASALKMCFGGWNKARTALLINLRTLATEHGVADALMAEWSVMDPAVLRMFDPDNGSSVMGNAYKAWRWSGEMREIAATFEQAGLPGGFHDGAAEVFERLERFKDATEQPPFGAMAAELLSRSEIDRNEPG